MVVVDATSTYVALTNITEDSTVVFIWKFWPMSSKTRCLVWCDLGHFTRLVSYTHRMLNTNFTTSA